MNTGQKPVAGRDGKPYKAFRRRNYQLTVAVLLTVAGVVLLFLSFFFAPQGEIHHSVLVAFGEVSTFAGALFGVDYSYRMKRKAK
ncbi:MAG: hypothetical protein LBV32_02000 [Tannerellaceae bacterium]|jgi:hypothetical protein|nr:hypothetical protein [Tannerellaceae bacterium]